MTMDNQQLGKCFIIQPFDKSVYDKRYHDTFKPAILEASLEPYRVDEDPSIQVPINDIERGIRESVICFAEITTDNPNVWYELGFAYACGKKVVMVCSDKREGKYPFDIKHRHIIDYKTDSSSDFTNLSNKITQKAKAFIEKSDVIERLSASPLLETEGLEAYEMALIALVMQSQFLPDDSVSINELIREMEQVGYNQAATSFSVKKLVSKKMLEVFKAENTSWGNQTEKYTACRLTPTGEGWVLSHEKQLQFKHTAKSLNHNFDDDVPF